MATSNSVFMTNNKSFIDSFTLGKNQWNHLVQSLDDKTLLLTCPLLTCNILIPSFFSHPFSSLNYPSYYHLLLSILPSLSISPSFHLPTLPVFFPAMCLTELAAVWPKSPSTGTTPEGAGPSMRNPLVCVCVLACVFVCQCVCRRVRLATRLHTCRLMRVWPRQHDLDLTGW